jgi:hypothetical protein
MDGVVFLLSITRDFSFKKCDCAVLKLEPEFLLFLENGGCYHHAYQLSPFEVD